MKFKLYRSFGALNSPAVFDAFAKGILANGHQIVESNEDIPVIWSVLWHGRMFQNQKIYKQAKISGKPVIIIEVGNFKRGVTWRISIDNINGLGIFGNYENLDPDRPKKLGINLYPYQQNRRPEILIASQHSKSLQWEGMPSMETWISDTVSKIRSISSRKIIVRPHPRSPLRVSIPNASIEIPKKIVNTYDDFDIRYNYHCVINYNSGPAIQAAISGTPVICHSSSLAFPVSNQWENIENLTFLDRSDWILKLSHTEWFLDEIEAGRPLARLLPYIEENLKKIS